MQYKFHTSFLILSLFLSCAGSCQSSQSSSKTAFLNGTVLTMSKAGVLRNHTVLTHGDTIISIVPSSSLKIPSDYNQIDASGKFLMPGLTDMHVHLSGKENLTSNLRYGVTSVLQMSGQRGQISDFLSLRPRVQNVPRTGSVLSCATAVRHMAKTNRVLTPDTNV